MQVPHNWNAPVTDDGPLSDREGEPASVGDVSDDGEREDETEYSPLPNAADRGETVCFEIGGAPPESDSVIVPSRPIEMPVQSPVASAPGGGRSYAEESVADRYAALDVGAPRLARTFEDASVPESWRTPRQASVPEPPMPPQPAAAPWSVGDAPVERLDEARTPGRRGQESAEVQPDSRQLTEYTYFADLDQGSHLTDFLEPELESIEEQLRSSIVDASQEIQSAVGRWDTIEPSHGSAEAEEVDVILPAEDAEYDVIEPGATRQFDGDGRDDGLTDGNDRPPGRYIPKPKYRHVFSTLRRRLGTTLRRKR